ncbi:MULTISPECIES: homoserine dehydrogenase [Planococcus]|uniref:Homoserine dehydrogenase n=1 Tax=Planococcus faecalis TaxID=1598147 RepID=A0ABM6IU40_9BACL|nr:MULTISPECIES: homoserine dehydrogenase [Planococcus]AQU80092.1 homoserine dehydrogenase [Planococcus faecalis]MDJ0330534.1 homoserine dehydrogenase [Planococcus sp. S3-L1]OHX52544.1 homoserine dehydrogenase [Planococcus faecalis]
MKNEISIGLLGLGTVGSGVAKIIQQHQQDLHHKLGAQVLIGKVLVRDTNKDRLSSLDPSVFTTDIEEILNDSSLDIIVEVMGGIDGAKLAIEKALRAGKQVVTANKDVMAEYGHDLLKLADAEKCDLFYEASVAGGVPIIRTLEDGLASDRISSLMGIVNGTTNFILTKMKKENMSYDDALAEATELGYAEADPSADVDGIDAARKMVILSSLAFSTEVHLDDVLVRGMKEIRDGDLELATKFGYTMKMVGSSTKDEDGIEVSVEPIFLANSHPLASVNNEFNAVYIYGDAVGETMLYGPGAGSLPTATSVVSDIIAACRNLQLGVNGKRAHSAQHERVIKPETKRFAKYCHRLLVNDEVGVLSKMTSIYSKHEASIQSVMQSPAEQVGKAELVLLTHQISRQQHLDVLSDLEGTASVISHYRIEGEETA